MNDRDDNRGETAHKSDDPRFGRRGFLEALTASFALAGSEGCRRAVENIVPYSAAPEQVVPGRPLHYATAFTCRGEALGVVVESHEGRPTKIEGNPLHPSSLGAADVLAQASILNLYDPDRAKSPTRAAAPSSWKSFEAEAGARLRSALATDGGKGVRMLVTPTNSPTVRRLREAWLGRFPRARVHVYSPIDLGHEGEAAAAAFGAGTAVRHAYDQARVILSLDCDFLQTEPGNVRAQKQFAAGRRIDGPRDTMNRLYVVEPALTTTGMAADHRLRLPASQVLVFAASLARALERLGLALGPAGVAAAKHARNDSSLPGKWLDAVARDILANGAQSLLVVGSRQPPAVHALAHAIHHALGALGTTVFAGPATSTSPGTRDIADLATAIRAGEVDTLFVLGGNPAYDAPADLAFREALGTVAFSARLSPSVDETARACTWHLPEAHELEAWGDVVATDGTLSVQQPLIQPLFEGRSEIEVLKALLGSEASPLDLVRDTMRDALLASKGLLACAPAKGGILSCTNGSGRSAQVPVLAFEHDWKKVLHDGLLPGAALPTGARPVDLMGIAKLIDAGAAPERPTSARLEVTFAVDAKMLDGRYANNSWLEELSDPVTKLAWDNAALLSPGTARELGIEGGDLIQIQAGKRTIEIAAHVLSGTADGVLVLPLGWGRTHAGRMGNGRGFDVYPLRTTDAMAFAAGVSVTKTGKRYELARTQLTDTMDGRPLARQASLAEYKAEPHFAELARPPRRSLPLWNDVDYSKGHQWGMSIDLNACTGCNACVVACQAENNIPVVGKEQVSKGRDMQWIRLDRYFVEPAPGQDADDVGVAVQPVACVQCEEAPCENVCPVAALEHSPEGLSEVTYNRCIGTRYCANNCPYKVRRFNYLNWHNDGVWKETGGLPETLQLQQNPDVTVRFRGVVEKCTYCVQRIQGSRLTSKMEGRALRDGDIVTACQQTCPADAIVFGDLNDMNSRLAKLVTGDRRYGLLEELGIKPRTTYLAKIKNPNPELA